MGALGYLNRKILRNRIRKAVRKPIAYVWLFLVLFYFAAVPMSLKMTVETLGADSPEGLVTVLTVFALWSIPANLIAYSRRKGLLYRNCDVQFLFQSPLDPKKILLYAHLKTLAVQALLNLFAVVCGRLLFHVEAWKMAVYFLFSIFLENILEACLVVVLYGSERLGEKHRSLVAKGTYGLAGILALMGIYAYLTGGLEIRALTAWLHSDMVQMVPVAGWYVAVLRMLFLGPTAVNLAGACCYVLLFVLVVAAAWRMECTGGFYEDAMKFAEDYEAVVESRRQGNNRRRLGRKEKFGRARVRWKGYGARALFYRQLLEYRKTRYFIFDISTGAAALCGCGMAYVYAHEGGLGFLGKYAALSIPGLSAYLIFVFTALNGKWSKELQSPYTYLIPDTAFRKLVYATAMQHVQSLVNACLITLPGAVVMKLPPVVTILCILFYVLFSANKLYACAVAELVCGNVLGRTGKQLMQMLIQGLAVFGAAVGGILGAASGGVLQACVMMDVFLVLSVVSLMVVAMLNFYYMETK